MLRYKLRTLLIAMVVCAICFGVIGSQVARHRVRFAALNRLQNAGSDTDVVWGGKHFWLTTFTLTRVEMLPDEATWRRKLPQDEIVIVRGRSPYQKGRPIEESDLLSLRSFPEVQKVSLQFLEVSDRGLENLRFARQLMELNLSNTIVTNDGIARCGKLWRLQSLKLEGTRCTGAGLQQLQLGQLKSLGLANTATMDHDLACLASATELEVLELAHTRVTDNALRSIASLSRLWRLDLDGTQITDRALQLIANLPSLQTLNISQTAVTAAATARLREQRPEIRIYGHDEVSKEREALEIQKLFRNFGRFGQ